MLSALEAALRTLWEPSRYTYAGGQGGGGRRRDQGGRRGEGAGGGLIKGQEGVTQVERAGGAGRGRHGKVRSMQMRAAARELRFCDVN